MAINMWQTQRPTVESNGDGTSRVTAYIEIDPDGLSSSSTSTYRCRLYVGSTLGSRRSWSDDGSTWSSEPYCDVEPGEYEVYAILTDSSGSALYDSDGKLVKTGVYDVTVEETFVAAIYYARIRLYGNGGEWTDGSSSVYFPDEDKDPEWASSFDDYADIDIYFDGSGFERDGYKLLGFATNSSASSAKYDVEDVYTVEATSRDEDDPTIAKLYAVWEENKFDLWDWESPIGGTLEIEQVSDTEYECSPLTAREWNNFLKRIQDVADKMGITLFSWPGIQVEAIEGTEMTMEQAQYAVACLEQLNPDEPVPEGPTLGYPFITEDFINGLKESLNSLIETL